MTSNVQFHMWALLKLTPIHVIYFQLLRFKIVIGFTKFSIIASSVAPKYATYSLGSVLESLTPVSQHEASSQRTRSFVVYRADFDGVQIEFARTTSWGAIISIGI
jgi:hypothetical protein